MEKTILFICVILCIGQIQQWVIIMHQSKRIHQLERINEAIADLIEETFGFEKEDAANGL